VAAYRACRCRGFAAHLELVGEQVAHAVVVHDHHHQIYAFDTDLQSPASTADGKERRCAPGAIRQAAGGDAPAMLSAEDECAFDEPRYHSDALGSLHNFFRNTL